MLLSTLKELQNSHSLTEIGPPSGSQYIDSRRLLWMDGHVIIQQECARTCQMQMESQHK